MHKRIICTNICSFLTDAIEHFEDVLHVIPAIINTLEYLNQLELYHFKYQDVAKKILPAYRQLATLDNHYQKTGCCLYIEFSYGFIQELSFENNYGLKQNYDILRWK